MSLMTHSLTHKEIASIFVKELQANNIPWQRKWIGAISFPKNIYTTKKYGGIDVLLLQLSAKEHGFKSCLWGTEEDFQSKVVGTPTRLSTSVVYNYDQVFPNEIKYIKPDYSLADKVLHAVPAKIVYNEQKLSEYYYPPKDFITLPKLESYSLGIGGPQAYYEFLTHELAHWTETRLDFSSCKEHVRELRAEITAALMMMEMKIPHSVASKNYNKYRVQWGGWIIKDYSFIVEITESATKAVDFLLSFSGLNEERHTNINSSL